MRRLLPGFLLLFVAPVAVSAQSRVPPPTRVFVNLGGGLQSIATTFGETHGDELYLERFTWDARYKLKNSVAFEGGVGVRAWQSLLTAVTYSRSQHSQVATVTGQVPHPFQFNQFRAIGGESASLRHEEQAIHVSALWIVPIGRRLEVGISGGPSFFFVRQGFVKQVEFAQDYPYDAARFARTVSAEVSEKAYGGHAAADLMWMMTPQAALGVLVRYSRGSVTFSTPSGGSVSLDAGGLQAGLGLRLGLGRSIPRTPQPPPKPAGPEGQIVLDDRGVVIEAAPIYLLPDARRTPLRTLTPGIVVKILEETGDWFKVEFRDQQFGPRIGYVQRRHVQRAKEK